MTSSARAVLFVCLFVSMTAFAQDTAGQIASWIQSKVNTGGYNGASCRRLADSLVKCEMHFKAGTSTSTVVANTKAVADTFAQIGRLAETIHYIGYSGAQRVCEYKYDMNNATVSQVK